MKFIASRTIFNFSPDCSKSFLSYCLISDDKAVQRKTKKSRIKYTSCFITILTFKRNLKAFTPVFHICSYFYQGFHHVIFLIEQQTFRQLSRCRFQRTYDENLTLLFSDYGHNAHGNDQLDHTTVSRSEYANWMENITCVCRKVITTLTNNFNKVTSLKFNLT